MCYGTRIRTEIQDKDSQNSKYLSVFIFYADGPYIRWNQNLLIISWLSIECKRISSYHALPANF